MEGGGTGADWGATLGWGGNSAVGGVGQKGGQRWGCQPLRTTLHKNKSPKQFELKQS